MAQSVLTRPKVALSTDRSAADCSRLGNFHTHAGLLDMVMCEPCIAGTKGVINRKTFTRSSQVLFPAFESVREYYDFFKVPLRYLWSKWNDWKININDLNSSREVYASVDAGGNFNIDLSQPTNVPRMNFTQAMLESLMSSPTSTPNLSHINKCNNMLRLLQQCGIKFGVSNAANNVVNLFKLGAYHKIYNDHYRNTTYESINQFSYNFDWLYDTAVNVGYGGLLNPSSYPFHLKVAQSLLTMHYVNWQNDYFHNIYPALTYVNSSPNGLNWTIPSSVVNVPVSNNANTFAVNNSIASINGNVGMMQNITTSTNAARLSVQTIRAAFALDKLMRASAYTPKHVREQIKARFGVDVGDKVSYESERIGGYVSDVSFGEVTQTVDTSAAGSPSNLGAVGGKGIGSSDFEEDLNFYCEEDSLIVGIHYFIPTAMYDKTQDPWVQNLVREDFFQPEFQNLGLRPVLLKNISGAYRLINPTDDNTIVGYTVPNELYKIGRSENYYLFNKLYELVEHDAAAQDYLIKGTFTSPLSAFTVHANSVDQYYSSTINADYFKVKPQVLDPLFAQAYLGRPDTDQFFGCFRIKFAKVHPMDVHGQPSL